MCCERRWPQSGDRCLTGSSRITVARSSSRRPRRRAHASDLLNVQAGCRGVDHLAESRGISNGAVDRGGRGHTRGRAREDRGDSGRWRHRDGGLRRGGVRAAHGAACAGGMKPETNRKHTARAPWQRTPLICARIPLQMWSRLVNAVVYCERQALYGLLIHGAVPLRYSVQVHRKITPNFCSSARPHFPTPRPRPSAKLGAGSEERASRPRYRKHNSLPDNSRATTPA